MLVILNDNEMSISENVGALNNHLAPGLSGDLHTSIREGGKRKCYLMFLESKLVRRTEEHLKRCSGTMLKS
ncbi:hypothetical protein OH492_05295 [Vibrio chagasii]|nr:hypothetical protein [Vibrio chagasii]